MASKTLFSLLCTMIIAWPGYATSSEYSTDSIRQHNSRGLQYLLEKCIKELHLSSAIRSKRLSVALVDVTDPAMPGMAQLNGDEMMYAASLPKIAILLAAFERIEQGKLKLNSKIRQTMTNMIRHSSNKAATQMIRAVGKDYINTVLASPKYRLYDKKYNGGLWVGKEYASGTAFHRDPLHQLSHGATALQVARFYYMLETGQLVSPAASREMKAMLGNPGINHKFVKGLSNTSAKIFRKSGSWRTFHADSALIEHNGHTYIAVALANDANGGEWMKKLIRGMDNIILTQHPHTNLAKAATGSFHISN